MKNIFKVLLISSMVLTGCSSTKAEAPQEKTPEQKGVERVSNILDPGKITVETDGVYKMDMTVSDFNFLSQRQFYDFVFNQRNRGKFKVLKVYLDNGATLTTDNGSVLIYNITLNSTVYKAIYFKYNPENGLYYEEKTNKLLEVNRNAAYPNYFE